MKKSISDKLSAKYQNSFRLSFVISIISLVFILNQAHNGQIASETKARDNSYYSWRALTSHNSFFSEVKTRAGPVLRYTPSESITDGSIAVDLITEPSGQRFPMGKQTVLVRPFSLATFGGRITVSGSIPSRCRSSSLKARRRAEVFH